MSMLSSIPLPNLYSYPKLNPQVLRLRSSSRRSFFVANTSGGRKPSPDLLRQLAASSAIFFLGFGLGIRTHSASAICTPQLPPVPTVVENQEFQDNDSLVKSTDLKNFEDKEMQDAFESWKSKTYSLTVPLRIIALRGSIPPIWVKDFLRSQGKRVRLLTEFRGSLEDIYSELLIPFMKGNIHRKSALAADLVTVSDSWLSLAIRNALIEPMKGIEEQDWYKGLSDKWKIFLCRNNDGILDSDGRIWTIPYRWGSMVIAYKKSKFQKHNLAPIEDWADLWRPELAGKIAMVNSPREVVGAVLKYMGASYNTNNIDSQVAGGRNAVRQNLALLEKQVRLFDSVHYLKAFGVGDVWVAVGWSSDVLPVAIRMSNVAVVVPKSGASLWADLWAIPAASRFATEQIGGRVRGPSPLVDQWIDFCLQPQRELPFRQMVVSGTSPPALGRTQIEDSQWMGEGDPKLDTNLIAGVPPSEILARCEFLEPLSDAALEDYRWLISSMQRPPHSLIQTLQSYILSVIQTFWPSCLQSLPKMK